MKNALPLLLILFVAGPGSLVAQQSTTNPPSSSGNPYAPRGNPQSPDRQYSWSPRLKPPLGYQLSRTASGRIIASVPSYFGKDAGAMAERYVKAMGVYWSADSRLVALDELNYRRAGALYFFLVQGNEAKPLPVNASVPKPASVVEARLCADKGWLDNTRFSVRLAMKLQNGENASLYYTVDLSQPENPRFIPQDEQN